MNSHPYDPLTPDTVIDAVESTGRLSDARLLALNSYENRVYQVGIEDGQPLIAKFYRPERWSLAQIEEEHSFSLELQDADISVVAPMVDDKGCSLHEYQGFLFALFVRPGGYPPELDNLENLLVLGRTLGRIHSVGKASRFGDCHVGNILWRDDVAHFVDLDDCTMAPAMQDLWMFLNGERHDREIQLSELIEGYSEFCDFDPKQLRWVEPLRTLRLINYAAWVARRWEDPAFPRSFTWFNTERYWAEHILELREQLATLQEEPLRLL